MKILHFILGKADKSRANGVNQVIAGLAKNLISNGCELRILGKAESVEREGEAIQRDGFKVVAYSKNLTGLLSDLRDSIRWADVVHLHGLYNLWNLFVALLCIIEKKPYVLTLHDGLAPARLKNRRRWLKSVYNILLQKRHIKRAKIIHVLTEEESTDLVNFVGDVNHCIIHNGVDLDEYPKRTSVRIKTKSKKLMIGYLGRFSVEKNTHNLIKAFLRTNLYMDAELILAGPKSHYLDKLLAKRCSDPIRWVGAKYGSDKQEFLDSLDIFVHPAICDVFSIGAMEALASGVPLLITRTSNTPYFFNRNAYFMCEPTVQGLCRGLENAIASRGKWREFSSSGRVLVEEVFNWRVASNKMMLVYEGILADQSV
ncbi:MAG: glycosyltransferase family 4 protein [Ekhidna sp.]